MPNPTVIGIFATVSLGLVLLALVVMYWREPAFLTFTGQQALDLRMLQEIADRIPPEVVGSYLGSLGGQEIQLGQPARVSATDRYAEREAEELERVLELITLVTGGEREEGS